MKSARCKTAVKMVMGSVAGCEGKGRPHGWWQQVGAGNCDIRVV